MIEKVFSVIQIDPLAASIAALAALVALQQYLVSRISSSQNEVILIAELRREWASLKDEWHAAILAVNGPDSYYTPAPLEMRQKFTKTIKELDKSRGEGGYESWKKGRMQSHLFEQSIRDCLFFLDSLSSAVFSGKISPRLAYTIVGPEVPRRSKQVRLMLGEGPIDSVPHYHYFVVNSYPGLKIRIFALIDVLWAEASRLGDLEHHELVKVAQYKKNKTGTSCRKRARRLTMKVSKGIFSRPKNALLIDRHLMWSQFVPEFGPLDSLKFETPREVLRSGIGGRIRRNIKWVGGLFVRGK